MQSHSQDLKAKGTKRRGGHALRCILLVSSATFSLGSGYDIANNPRGRAVIAHRIQSHSGSNLPEWKVKDQLRHEAEVSGADLEVYINMYYETMWEEVIVHEMNKLQKEPNSPSIVTETQARDSLYNEAQLFGTDPEQLVGARYTQIQKDKETASRPDEKQQPSAVTASVSAYSEDPDLQRALLESLNLRRDPEQRRKQLKKEHEMRKSDVDQYLMLNHTLYEQLSREPEKEYLQKAVQAFYMRKVEEIRKRTEEYGNGSKPRRGKILRKFIDALFIKIRDEGATNPYRISDLPEGWSGSVDADDATSEI